MLSSVSLLNTICFGAFFFSIYTVYTDLMPEMMYNKTKFAYGRNLKKWSSSWRVGVKLLLLFNKKMNGSGGIRTHASEETGALNQRLRPLGHATVYTLPCYLEYTWLSHHWGKKIKAKEWAIWTMVWFYYHDQNSFFFHI